MNGKTKRSGIVMRAGFAGMLCNLLLFLFKLGLGLMAHSVSVLADAFNNLSDAASSLLSLFSARLSEKAAELEKSFRESLKKEKLRLKLQKMNSPKTAAFLSISEEGRRMNDMMRMYAMQGMSMGEMPVEETLLLNAEHPLVKHLLSVRDTEDGKLIEKQLYDLAKLQQAPLSASEMADFIERSNSLLLRIKS